MVNTQNRRIENQRSQIKNSPVSIIETINLTKRYGDLTALNNLNMTIEEGDCFGFIGPNGAGKTTTIKILATLLRPDWGEARIAGWSVGRVDARNVRMIIGYVPDYFGSYENMVVREYLEFFCAAYQIDGPQRNQVVANVLELTDLAEKVDVEVNSLSRGMQQRLSVARVLLHDPKVLLLDEPASGLDPRARIEMRELLKELHRMGKTILISSHILLELADLCNKVGIIERGELRFTGTMHDTLERARMGRVLHVVVQQRPAEAADLIAALPGVGSAQVQDGRIRVEMSNASADASAVAAKLVNGGFGLLGLEEEKVDLETAFMRLTEGKV